MARRARFGPALPLSKWPTRQSTSRPKLIAVRSAPPPGDEPGSSTTDSALAAGEIARQLTRRETVGTNWNSSRALAPRTCAATSATSYTTHRVPGRLMADRGHLVVVPASSHLVGDHDQKAVRPSSRCRERNQPGPICQPPSAWKPGGRGGKWCSPHHGRASDRDLLAGPRRTPWQQLGEARSGQLRASPGLTPPRPPWLRPHSGGRLGSACSR